MGKKKYSTEEILEMLKKANSKNIHIFIANRVQEDESLRQALGQYLDKPSTKTSSAQDFERRTLKALKRAFDEVMDQWGYSEYSDEDFVREVERILKRIRKESPSSELRISLQIKFLDLFDISTNFYEYEVFGEFIEEVIEDFQNLLNTSDEDQQGLRKYLCETCLGYLGQFQMLSNELEDLELLEDFVLENLWEESPDQIKEYINTKIHSILSSEEKLWSKDYHISGYVNKMLNILSKSGVTEKELLGYAKNHWGIDGVRGWFITHYKKSGQLEKAIKVLEESLDQDKDKVGLVSEYKTQLKKLYRKTSKTDRYCEILLEEIKQSGKAELAKFKELKSLWDKDLWTKASEEIFNSQIESNEVLAQYLSEDHQYLRLLQLILSPEISYDIFNHYAPTLPSEYSNQILEKYQEFFESMLSKAKTRKQYQELMFTLEDSHTISGGRTLTQSLTSKWLKVYESRPVLCDEIQKFQSRYKPKD